MDVRVKDYITTQDFTKEELLDMVNLGILIKKHLKEGKHLNVLYIFFLCLYFIMLKC